ncbi:ANK1 [Symbiodinium sp. CCMP2592]|nr:ANK1 [Symbiodinium sp. CCMP2592]
MARATALGHRLLRHLKNGALARGSTRSCGAAAAPGRRRLGAAALGAGASVLLVAWAARKYLDHLRIADLQSSVHRGNSSARLARVERQLEGGGEVVVSFTAADGRQSTVVVDKGQLASATSQRGEALAAAEKSLRKAASTKLAAELAACFAPIEQRASNFADWYFAYPTTIKLVREADSQPRRFEVGFLFGLLGV